jgi:hypothetical protein
MLLRFKGVLPRRDSRPAKMDGMESGMVSKSYTTVILSDPDGSSMTAIDVPFDPKPVFGKVRAPVIVKVGKYAYRSTICIMAGKWWVPLRKSNREAAGVEAGQQVRVTLTLDEALRTVAPPADLRRALKAAGMLKVWQAMSFTHQREYAESVAEAKKPETRRRRIEGCVAALLARESAVSSKARTMTNAASKMRK